MNRNKKINWEVGRAFQLQDEFFDTLNKSKIEYGSICVYEGISLCRWNGGRFLTKENMSYSNISKFYERGINIGITMTNSNIDLSDKLGNETLEKFYKKGNRIILRNESLRKHIIKNFPEYSTTYSITASYSEEVLFNLKGENLWDFYKKKQDEYDIVVIPKELLEPPLFEKINCLDISRLEFVVDNDCYLYCPIAGKMYRLMNLLNRVPPFGKLYDYYHKQTCLPGCPLGPECFDYWYDKKRLQSLIDMGLNRFKIARHEEYTPQRLQDQWNGYFVDYDNDIISEKELNYWKVFREEGRKLKFDTRRNIINH